MDQIVEPSSAANMSVPAVDLVDLQRESQYWPWVMLVVAAALGVRIAVVSTQPQEIQFPDGLRYDAAARSLLAGQGLYVSLGHVEGKAQEVPGYPLFLAAHYKVLREISPAATPHLPVRLSQALLGALSCWLLYGIVSPLFGRKAAVLAAALMAIDPWMIFFNGLMLAEALFIFIWLMMMMVLIQGRRWPRWIVVLTLSIIFASATYVRPAGFLFLPLLVICYRYSEPRFWHAILGGLALVALSVMWLLPWGFRNQQETGAFTLLHHGGGISFYEAQGPQAVAGPGYERIDAALWQQAAQLDEVQRSRMFSELALYQMKSDPLRALKLGGQRIARTWNPVPNDPAAQQGWAFYISAAYCLPVFALAVTGLIIHWGRWWPIVLTLATPIYFTGIHMLFVGSIRYRLPAMPFVHALAAAALIGYFGGSRRATGSGTQSGEGLVTGDHGDVG